MAKLPSFQFYPGDWLKDPALRSCSRSARGTFMDVLCLLFESEVRGVAVVNNKPLTESQICYALGGDPTVVVDLSELLNSGVLKRRDDGAIFSARMIRDEEMRQLKAKAGRKGMKQRYNRPSNTRLTPPVTAPEDEEEVVVAVSRGVEGGNGLAACIAATWALHDDEQIGEFADAYGRVGATPNEIKTRRQRLRDLWGDKADTPKSLLAHWGKFAQATLTVIPGVSLSEAAERERDADEFAAKNPEHAWTKNQYPGLKAEWAAARGARGGH